jgi:putative ABC transport system permease protein
MDFWPPPFANPEVVASFKQGKGAFVSNNFAKLYDVQPGGHLNLDTPTGRADFEVFGEVDDYSWQHGAFIVDGAFLKRRWKNNEVSYIDASVAPGFTVQDVKRRIQAAASTDRQAYAYDKQEIRALTDSVLEQVVSMANLQAVIAIFIGVLGIVNAIWIGVMNRRREIALLRSIGVTRRQIHAIVVFESLFVAAVAAMVGSIGGLYGGWFPLRSFSFAVTGYLYPRVTPWAHVIEVIVLALFLGLIAGFFPAQQATNLPVIEGIGYE